MFLQDSWRLKPTVTVNGGLRWDLQTPFQSSNDIFSSVTLADLCGVSGLGDGSIYDACKFFTPNASGGKVPVYSQLVNGTNGYNIDWNNVSPNINVAWRPNVQSGFLRTILGDPEQATIRGGFSVQFERQGFGAFTGVYGGNPGSTLALNRNASAGNLVLAGRILAGPVFAERSARSRGVPAESDLPDRAQAEPGEQHQRFPSGHPGGLRENVDPRTVARGLPGHGC